MGRIDAAVGDADALAYSADRAGNTFRGEIDHPPWPLQKAQGTVNINTLGDGLGIQM